MFNDPHQEQQPKDMFEEQQAENPLSNVMAQDYAQQEAGGINQKKGIIIAIGVVVILALLTGAGFAIYSVISKKPSTSDTAQQIIDADSQTTENLPPQDDSSATTPVQPSDFSAPPSSDSTVTDTVQNTGDQQTGTAIDPVTVPQDQTQNQVVPAADPSQALKSLDTDSDGLSDYDETYLYFTSSTSADSDGDGYGDGDEIKNGYNPLGQGKITDEQKLQWKIQ